LRLIDSVGSLLFSANICSRELTNQHEAYAYMLSSKNKKIKNKNWSIYTKRIHVGKICTFHLHAWLIRLYL
jgi:hypothetical protein